MCGILTTSHTLSLLKQRVYVIKNDVVPITRLGVVSIFTFFKIGYLGSLFTMSFISWLSSTYLFQAFYLPRIIPIGIFSHIQRSFQSIPVSNITIKVM